MGEDTDKQKGFGFSGISSLLPDDPSEVATEQRIPENSGIGSRPSAKQPSTRAPASPSPQGTASPWWSKQSTPRPRSGDGAIWTLIGIIVVIFVIAVVSQPGTQQASQPTSEPQVAQTDSSTQPSTPNQNDQAHNTVTTTSQPTEPVLQKPPISSGSVFSVAEIRYCLALKQQVEGAQPVVDTYSQDQVGRFNKMVNDYNSRCHDFRYQAGDLEEAQRDVAPYAKQFQAEGWRLVRGKDTSSSTAQQPAEPVVTRTMVGDAQHALNELGYNVGAPDGIMGPKTRAAIKAFQRKTGLVSDGQVSDQLLRMLNSATRSSRHALSSVDTTQSAGVTSTTPISNLTYDEKNAIETACVTSQAQGAASYNRCLIKQLRALGW